MDMKTKEKREIAEREQDYLIELIQREMVPAIGCTEPIAVALCTAKATETLGCPPSKIEVYLSSNVLKNAMGVGIPGTGGMIGLPIAVALGAVKGKSEYQLEVLKDVTEQDVEVGKRIIEEKQISIMLKDGIEHKLYIEVICKSEHNRAVAVISGEHTTFTHIAYNNEVLLDVAPKATDMVTDEQYKLSMRKVYDFAIETPIEKLRFILEAARLNKSAAEVSLKGNYGHELGRALSSPSNHKVVGNNSFTNILSYTSAACDARMAGAKIPVMSNSGSGNQGIAATLPVVIYAEDNDCSEESLIRALVLSNLTVIYIKQNSGRLSALCGCVIAATGSACGIVTLMGGGYIEVSSAVKNMIANLTGMICDGAKPSCSMKLTSGVATALLSAMLAMNGKCVTSVEGIIDHDVDKCISNLAIIGSQGMAETDRMVLEIMVNKS